MNVHPFDAAMLSLVGEALKGKPCAIKKAIQILEKAGNETIWPQLRSLLLWSNRPLWNSQLIKVHHNTC